MIKKIAVGLLSGTIIGVLISSFFLPSNFYILDLYECILLTEGGGGWEGGQRKKRKGGRVSNLMKTFEQGDRQRNKITFYTLKNYGHPSAGTKLCASGAVERLCESDIVRSASKRAKISR